MRRLALPHLCARRPVASFAFTKAVRDTAVVFSCGPTLNCVTSQSPPALFASGAHTFHKNMSETRNAVVSLLSQEDAKQVDVELMGDEIGFSLEQLMELAGLAVAHAVYRSFPAPSASAMPAVLALCGPGNNGGDGLVAARHLTLMGYSADVVYPKPTDRPHYHKLVKQCRASDVRVLGELPPSLDKYDCVIDALFGFSFHGEMREPFAAIVKTVNESNVPVVAVDIPSGWDVENGDTGGTAVKPSVLVSLTAPKKMARHFKGRHWLGGRFVPPSIQTKYNLQLPAYAGTDTIVDITPCGVDDT